MATYNQTNKNCKQVQQGSENMAINNEKGNDNDEKDLLNSTINSKRFQNEIKQKDKQAHLHAKRVKKQGSKHHKKYSQFENENEKKCDCGYQAYRQPQSQKGLNHYRFGGPHDNTNPILKYADYPVYQQSSNKPTTSQDTNFNNHNNNNNSHNGRSKSRSPPPNVEKTKGGRPRPKTRSPIKPRQGPRGRH